MEYNIVVFSDLEDGNQPESETKTRMVEVSEKTKRFLHEKCTQRVPNALRKEIRDNYPLPKVPATRIPMLDPMMKPEASAASKSMDKQLEKVQTLVLDSLAPLISVVEAHNRCYTSHMKEVIQAVKAAIQLVGNANAHMSHLRGEKIVSDINKSFV